MKKLIVLIMFAASSAFATDRDATSRESALADTHSDRIALARDNADYTPAVRPEASRELMVAQDRNARNRHYKPTDARFLEGRMAQVVNSASDVPESGIERTRVLIWRKAVEETPALLILKNSLHPNTYAWYLFREYERQSALDAVDTLEELKKVAPKQ